MVVLNYVMWFPHYLYTLPEDGPERDQARVVEGKEKGQHRAVNYYYVVFAMAWYGTDINTRIIYPVLWRVRIFLGILQ